MNNDFISIRNGDAFIDKESKLVEITNSHYIRENIACYIKKLYHWHK